MTLAAFICAFLGFGTLSASMTKHHRDLFGRPPSRWTALPCRVLGWSLLAMSLALSIMQAGPLIGIVLWTGLLTVSILGVALLLTYRDKWWPL